MEKCPICEKGYLKKIMNREVIYGVYLGDFPAKKCSFCNEIWTDGKTMEKIEEIAKEKGVWGLGVKTKITKAGNSLCVRIPNRIANFLNLKSGEEAYIHPEENKLIIEDLNKIAKEGRKRAEKLGIKERDVPKLVHKLRGINE